MLSVCIVVREKDVISGTKNWVPWASQRPISIWSLYVGNE